MSALAAAMIVLGLFFMSAAAIGMVRLPDVFTRSHALALTDSLGALFVLGGLAVHQGLTSNAVRILIVLGLLYLLNPVITHATVRAAWRAGERPAGEDAP